MRCSFWAALAGAVWASLVTVEMTAAASQTGEINNDFEKSICRPLSKNFKKSIAIRLHAGMDDEGRVFVDAGFPQIWKKSFLLNSSAGVDLMLRTAMDGWAVYQMDDATKPFQFTVQYMFGDTGGHLSCISLPGKPELTTVEDMPALAVKMYLTHFDNDVSGDDDTLRRRLLAHIGQSSVDGAVGKLPEANVPKPTARDDAIKQAQDLAIALSAVPSTMTQPVSQPAPPAGDVPAAAKVPPAPSMTKPETFACQKLVDYGADPVVKRLARLTDEKGDRYFGVGDGEWRQYFKGATANQRDAFWSSSETDGWVVWQLQRQPVMWITVQYMFASPTGSCIEFPDRPEHINPSAMPRDAVSHYHSAVFDGNLSDTDAMRRHLRNMEGRPLPTDRAGLATFLGLDSAKDNQPVAPKKRTIEEDVNVMDVPEAVLAKVKWWRNYCKKEQHAEASFTEKYIEPVDIDMDGKYDYVVNEDEVDCIRNGEATGIHGNGGTGLTIFMANGAKCVTVFDQFVQSATIRAFKGYGVLEAGNDHQQWRLVLKKSGAQKLKKTVEGGNQVYELSR